MLPTRDSTVEFIYLHDIISAFNKHLGNIRVSDRKENRKNLLFLYNSYIPKLPIKGNSIQYLMCYQHFRTDKYNVSNYKKIVNIFFKTLFDFLYIPFLSIIFPFYSSHHHICFRILP